MAVPGGIRQWHFRLTLWRNVEITLKRDRTGRWQIDLDFPLQEGGAILFSRPNIQVQGIFTDGGGADVRTVSVSTVDPAQANVVAVNEPTPLGNRFDFTTIPDVTITGERLWRNLDRVRLGKLAPRILETTLARDFVFVTPAEVLAFTGTTYQSLSLIPVYYDRVFDKITYMAGGLGSTQNLRLTDPSVDFNPPDSVSNFEAASWMMYTIDADVVLRDPSAPSPNQVTTFTDVAASTVLTVDWNLQTLVPAGTVPGVDGPFDIDTQTDTLIDGGATVFRADVNIVGTVTDGVASTVTATLVPSFDFDITGTFETGLDISDATITVYDPRSDLFSNLDVVTTGPLAQLDGKYASNENEHIEQNEILVSFDQLGSFPGGSNYKFPAHLVVLVQNADGTIGPGFAGYPTNYTHTESATAAPGGQPRITHSYRVSGYLYEGVNVIRHTTELDRGFAGIDRPGRPSAFSRYRD